MEVLYADNHIIVVNKPAGIATESSDQVSLELEVKEWVRQKYNKAGAVFAKAAHRLDKSVSGIVVFAKTSKALQRLHESFRSRKVKKTYFALVEGKIAKQEDLLEDDLLRKEFCSCVDRGNPLAKKAILSYKVLKYIRDNTFIEVHLHTGRYHQIRVQFSSRGHPIVNDKKYGAKQVTVSHQIALHHGKLEMIHPTLLKEMTFTQELPRNWNDFVQD